MKITKTIWLNSNDVCSFEHVVEVSGIKHSDLLELIDAGVIQPSGTDRGNYMFHTECIVVARQARRLREDFELDTQGLALAMTLLGRIHRLEEQLDNLYARLPRPEDH